jgi:hypothetical protein
MLTVDTDNPGKIPETHTDGSPLPEKDTNWEGLLVSDGYRSQAPTYLDIGIFSPQALTLTGKPVVMAPIAADPHIRAGIKGGPAGIPRGVVPIVIAAQQPQRPGQHLVDSFTAENYGDYQAHYQSMGIEIDSPEGGPAFYAAAAAGPDNILAAGQTLAVTLDIDQFGDVSGFYALKAGYNSVPQNAESSAWLTLFYPASSASIHRVNAGDHFQGGSLPMVFVVSSGCGGLAADWFCGLSLLPGMSGWAGGRWGRASGGDRSGLVRPRGLAGRRRLRRG